MDTYYDIAFIIESAITIWLKLLLIAVCYKVLLKLNTYRLD